MSVLALSNIHPKEEDPTAGALLDPGARDPLGLALERVDLGEQLVVGAIRLVVDDDHVEEVAVLVLHVAGLLDYVLELLLLVGLVVLDALLLELLEARRRHEDDVRLEIAVAQDLEGLGVQVEDADLAGTDDAADGLDRGAVVGLLELAVLDELATEDVRLELLARYEVVVLAVDLRVLARPACV